MSNTTEFDTTEVCTATINLPNNGMEAAIDAALRNRTKTTE